jgi:serine/threonine protein kinase
MSSVADFVPQSHLGSGASGVVRLVRRKADGRLYALKELEMPRGSSEVATMLQESHILASVDHPFVIRYYDSFVELSRLYLVME